MKAEPPEPGDFTPQPPHRGLEAVGQYGLSVGPSSGEQFWEAAPLLPPWRRTRAELGRSCCLLSGELLKVS